MQYLNYRENLVSGDVVAWKGKSLVSKIIRLFTNSEYSHVGLVWVSNNRVFIIEAVYPLVRIVPLSSLLPCYVISMGKSLEPYAESNALSMVGVATYSAWEAILSYFGLNRDPSSWQCVEFVKSILKDNNQEILGLDTPSEFILNIQKQGKSVIYLE